MSTVIDTFVAKHAAKHAAKSEAKILSAKQKQRDRLQSLANNYQGADRILTGESLHVKITEDEAGPAVAWTDGTTIWINGALITAVDYQSIERMNGINFHELSHVLYTPRRGTSLVQWILDNAYHSAFNILEDQRIETLLTTRYPSSVPWLTTAIARWVLAGDSADTGYLFVRGRKFLSGRLRGALRATFVRQDLLAEVDQIVDEYRLLAFPGDYEDSKPLIERFAAILREVTPTGQGTGGNGEIACPHSHDTRPIQVLTSGRPKGPTEQKVTRDQVRSAEPEEKPEEKPEPTPEEKPETDESDSEKSEDKGDEPDFGDDDLDDEFDIDEEFGFGDLDDEGDKGDDEGSSPIKGTGQGQSGDKPGEPSDSPSNAAGNEAGSLENILTDIAKEVLAEVLDNDEVREDIRRMQRQLRGNGGSDILDKSTWEAQPPLAEFGQQFGKLFRILDRLRQSADPGWQDRQTNGRINAERWNREADITSAFDLWDEGVHDVTSMEVVLMVDESGSMSSCINQAVSAMWVIKRALDKVDASTTVITFDDQSRTLYHRTEKATTDVRYSFHGGGTNPVDGFAQAARIFQRTEKVQKVLICFTDGEWYQSTDEEGVSTDEYIKRLNEAGVITALGFIKSGGYGSHRGGNSHGVQIHKTVTPDGLIPFVQGIVTESIKRTIGRR